jgi:hypothetical protein
MAIRRLRIPPKKFKKIKKSLFAARKRAKRSGWCAIAVGAFISAGGMARDHRSFRARPGTIASQSVRDEPAGGSSICFILVFYL